jgi:serine/arginine repetitive matrix protein 2
MYNGIGLTTPRGSGTSGHITKNLSHVKPEFFRNKIDINTGKSKNGDLQGMISGKANKEILDHNKKREIESKLYEMQEMMVEQGYSDEEIKSKIDKEKRKLEDRGFESSKKKGSSTDTHMRDSRKKEEDLRIRNAFGIKRTFVEGDSFDEEIIAQKKTERQRDRDSKEDGRRDRDSNGDGRQRERESNGDGRKRQRE